LFSTGALEAGRVFAVYSGSALKGNSLILDLLGFCPSAACCALPDLRAWDLAEAFFLLDLEPIKLDMKDRNPMIASAKGKSKQVRVAPEVVS
jgi:hypothetical protein